MTELTSEVILIMMVKVNYLIQNIIQHCGDFNENKGSAIKF